MVSVLFEKIRSMHGGFTGINKEKANMRVYDGVVFHLGFLEYLSKKT